MRTRIVAAAAAFLLVGQIPAGASTGLFASEVTQLLNHAQLIMRYIQAAQHLVSSINQEAMMVQNLKHLGVNSFSNISSDLMQLSSVVQGGNAIAYSAGAMDSQFRAQFPGYATYAANHPYYTDYQNWSKTNMDTITATLRGSNIQASALQNDQTLLATLRSQWATSPGAMGSMQMMGQVGDQEVSQLMALRQLMIQDSVSKTTWQGQQAQIQAADTAAAQKFFSDGGGSVQGDTRAPDPVH